MTKLWKKISAAALAAAPDAFLHGGAAPAAERRAKRKRAVLRQTKACLRAHPTGAQSPPRAMIMQNT